jgi:hypothetical protein
MAFAAKGTPLSKPLMVSLSNREGRSRKCCP